MSPTLSTLKIQAQNPAYFLHPSKKLLNQVPQWNESFTIKFNWKKIYLKTNNLYIPISHYFPILSHMKMVSLSNIYHIAHADHKNDTSLFTWALTQLIALTGATCTLFFRIGVADITNVSVSLLIWPKMRIYQFIMHRH